MARKQKDYLADLLADDSPDDTGTVPATGEQAATAPVEPARARPTTLLSRESALARIASGEVRQVTQVFLDPARVSVWPGNARDYAHLNEENCRELIDAIIAEGGQKMPATVRKKADDPQHDYEVIVGTRRHWAITWLRRNSYPDIQFVAQVANIDDEAAFRLADIENRARADVSDLERARNYAAALHDHYGGVATRMADRIKVSKGWLSKMLKVATIPDDIVAAFSSPQDIQLKPGYALAQLLDNAGHAAAIGAVSQIIASEQDELRASGRPPYPAAEVMRRLVAATQAPLHRDTAFTFQSSIGRDALSVVSVNRQGATLRLHAGSGTSEEELIRGLREALAHLDACGKSPLR